jgi:Holliday junction resolvase-like predicted endonuclease
VSAAVEVPVKDALAMERFRNAVAEASFAWCGARTWRVQNPDKSKRSVRFDIEIIARDTASAGRLQGLTRHELEIASSVLEAIRRGADR